MNAEVKPGYKLTEVGVIPEDWEVNTLECYWSVLDCKHVTAQFIVNGYPIASIKEVQSRFVDLNNAKQTTRQFYNILIEGGRKPRAGDLIISRNATVGEVSQVFEWHPLFAMGQDVCLMRKKLPSFSTNYLQAVFQSSIIGYQLLNLMVGTTFKRANVQQIKNLVVPMPAPSEQEAIAEALNDADALIESLEQLIKKKRQIKQGAMQELLTGKKRLPGFRGEWVVKRLGDVVKISKGQLITEKNAISGDIPVIAGGKKPAYFHNKPNRTGKTITISASGASAGYVAFFYEPIFASDCSTISESNDSSIEFIYSQLLLKQDIIFKSQTGGAQPHIHAVDLMPIEIGTPSLFEQKAIASIHSDMDTEIDVLEEKLAKYQQIKQGMMHNLFTGKIRLL